MTVDKGNMKPQARIRAARADDAARIAVLHVTSWRETYTDLLPRTMLDTLSVADRKERWARILNKAVDHDNTKVFIAELDGEPIGFASSASQRDQTLFAQGFSGEITAIYLLRSMQRRGVGSRLMAAVALALRTQGHNAASLWVLKENNRARRFYERLGGVIAGKKEERREAATLTELAYAWPDLSSLLTPSQPRT